MKTNKGILELAHGKKERTHKPVFSYIVEGMNFPLARVRPGLVLFSCLKAERAKVKFNKKGMECSISSFLCSFVPFSLSLMGKKNEQ